MRAISVLGVGVTIAALAVAAPADAGAAVGDPSVLAKTAQDVTHPGADPVNHGDTVNWVLSYTDNSAAGPAPASITDPIDAAGTNQTYVPGSLQVPPGWTPSFSTDGATFTGTDPGTATVAVRATNPAARQGGTNLAGPLLAPVQPEPTSTGGDGFTPIVRQTPSGEIEAWNMYHQVVATDPKVVCSDLTTGRPCVGGAWPRPVNTTPGPFGAGFTGDIASTLTPQYVRDPDDPDQVFYAAVTASSLGVGCFDMAAHANCGYVPLATGGTAMSGFVADGGNIYGVGPVGQVLCMTLVTRQPCANQPYASIVPAGTAGRPNFEGSLTVAGGKVFASSSPSAGTPVLGCFDPTTTSACAGWPAPQPVGPLRKTTFNAYTAFDQAGNEIGACATTNGAPNSISTCYALDGSALPAPTVFDGLPSFQQVFNPETVRAAGGDLKSYFGTWGGTNTGATVCYDWTTASACAGFPLPDFHPGVNAGDTLDYGYSFEPTTRCLFGLGDVGILFSEDPATGASPCIHSGASVTMAPSNFYCDGGTNHVRGYADARLEGLNLADVDLTSSTADVTDADGTVISHPAFAPDGSIDLSGISVAAHPSIAVTVHLVLRNGNDFTGGNQPHVVVSFVGDPPQVCFQTTVAAACAATSVTDTATGTDATGDFTSNTVRLGVAPGADCQPNVTVNKEICAADNDVDCGPGGAGPWVKQTGVGVAGVLLAHPRWRITITNTGPVTAADVRVNDGFEPSCVTAAGTFDLAAGASRQVFCSTSVLLSLLPLTNTASATFVAAGAPAGTEPTTTAGSSAVGCPLLCQLQN